MHEAWKEPATLVVAAHATIARVEAATTTTWALIATEASMFKNVPHGYIRVAPKLWRPLPV